MLYDTPGHKALFKVSLFLIPWYINTVADSVPGQVHRVNLMGHFFRCFSSVILLPGVRGHHKKQNIQKTSQIWQTGAHETLQVSASLVWCCWFCCRSCVRWFQTTCCWLLFGGSDSGWAGGGTARCIWFLHHRSWVVTGRALGDLLERSLVGRQRCCVA